MLHFTLSSDLLMNVSILIAMTAPIPVRLIVTISIAMFVKTKTHSNHSLKREIMVAISWPLAGSLFVCLSDMTTTGVAGEYCLICCFRKCCGAKKQKINLFYSLGVTFVTAPYTSVSINWIQFQWFDAGETQLHSQRTKSLRPSDAYMRRKKNHHWFR